MKIYTGVYKTFVNFLNCYEIRWKMNEIGLSCIGDWCEMDRPNWSCQQGLHYDPRPFSQNLIVLHRLNFCFRK